MPFALSDCPALFLVQSRLESPVGLWRLVVGDYPCTCFAQAVASTLGHCSLERDEHDRVWSHRIGLAPSLSVALLASRVIGAASGYNNILLMTWLQGRVAPAMRGRIMSLMMFASVGLNPISTALAGVFIEVNATALLVCAGDLMKLLTSYAAFGTALRAGIGVEPISRMQ